MLCLLAILLKQQQQTKYGDEGLLEVVLCETEMGWEGKKNEILKVLLCLLEIMKSLKTQVILDHSSRA